MLPSEPSGNPPNLQPCPTSPVTNDHFGKKLRRCSRSGGCPFLVWEGESKGPNSKSPTFPRVGTPKGRSRCGLASRFGIHVAYATFRRGNGFPISTLQQQLRVRPQSSFTVSPLALQIWGWTSKKTIKQGVVDTLSHESCR